MKQVLIITMMLCCANAWSQGLIIGHNCTDISQVPPAFIDSAKAHFKCTYGHTSHGSQIVSGMQIMENNDPVLFNFASDRSYYLYGNGEPLPDSVLSFWDYVPEGDLGNPDYSTWATRTDVMLSNSDGAYDIYPHGRNFVMWSWCGQAATSEANINLYLSLMTTLENNYPDVTFIYMTGHLNGTGETGTLHLRNEQIRQYCRDNNKVLFDFADIESYDPDGDYFLDLYATDNCDYTGGNWADEWCAEHPGDPLCETCSCAHSRPLNCNLKGRAFWWMMARLAGWTGVAPQNLTVSYDGSDIVLNWDEVPGAVAYQVLSSDNPDTGFTEDLTGTFDGTSWSTPLPAAPELAKFYCVTAVY
ncbi:hypothetical protein KKC97_12045 [bacterium]|nr:hypothetical protein [bacterium]